MWVNQALWSIPLTAAVSDQPQLYNCFSLPTWRILSAQTALLLLHTDCHWKNPSFLDLAPIPLCFVSFLLIWMWPNYPLNWFSEVCLRIANSSLSFSLSVVLLEMEMLNHRLLQVLLSSACGCFGVTVNSRYCAKFTKCIGSCWAKKHLLSPVFVHTTLFYLHMCSCELWPQLYYCSFI